MMFENHDTLTTEEEEEKVAKCLVETIKCHLYLFVSRPQSSYIQ